MAISEEARYALHRALEECLGADQAHTLMEHLPPVGWADVSTKRDVDGTAILLRAEMQTLRTELKGDMEALRTELKGDIAASESRMETTLHRELRQQLYAIIAVLAAFASGAAALDAFLG